MGLVIAVVLAVPLAMWSAANAGGVIDRIISGTMFGILSVPSFLMGLLLIMIFANGLGWFPRAQWVRIGEDPVGNLHHAIMPAGVTYPTEPALFPERQGVG